MSVNAGSAVGYLDLDISSFLTNLKTAQSQADSISSNTANKISKNFASIGSKMSSLGKTLSTTITAPIAAIGTAALKAGSDFEAQMSKVEAISGATADEMQALTAKAKEMGAKTKFSATESAQAFEYMAMAGWKSSDMLNGIEGIMNLAAASGEDLALVSDIVTDAMTGFGLSAKDSAHFADVLASASSNSNTNVAMLGESFKYVAPVAGSLGYSIEDTSIALGLMANSGIKASSAGTQLRAMLTNLAKPTDKIYEAMEYLNISLTDSNGNMKSLQELMNDLRKSFSATKMSTEEFNEQLAQINSAYENGNLTEKQYNDSLEVLMENAYGAEGALKAKYAATIAGKEGMSGLLAIVNASESDYEKLTKAIYGASDSYDGQGEAARQAAIMIDNLQGQITLLKSALEGIAISMYEIVLPYISQFVKNIQGLADWINGLTQEEKQQIVQLGLFAALVGPVTLVIGKLFTAVGKTITIFTNLGKAIQGMTYFKHLQESIELSKAGLTKFAMQTSKVGAVAGKFGLSATAAFAGVVIIIGTLVAAFVHLWKTNDKFREKILSTIDRIKKSFEDFVNNMQTLIDESGLADTFKKMVEALKVVWDGFCQVLGPIFSSAFEQIANILQTVFEVLENLFIVFQGLFTGNWGLMWQGIKGVFSSIWNDGIVAIFETAVNGLKEIADVILGWFGTDWNTTWNSIKDFFISAWQTACDKVGELWNSTKNIFNSVVDWFKDKWNSAKEIFNSVVKWFNDLGASIQDAFTTAKNTVVNFFTSVIDWVKDIPNKIVETWESIKQWAASVKDSAVQFIQNAFKVAVEKAKEFWNDLVWTIQNFPWVLGYVAGEIARTIVDFVKSVIDKIKEIWNTTVEFVKSLPDRIIEFLSNLWNTIRDNALAFFESAKQAVIDFVTNVKDNIVTMYKNTKEYWSNMVTTAIEKAKEFVNNSVEYIKSLPEKIKNYLVTTYNNVKEYWTNMVTTAVEKAKEFVEKTIDKIKETPSKVKEKLTETYNNVKERFTTMVNTAKEKASDFVNKVVQAITSLPSKFKQKLDDIINKVTKWAKDLFHLGDKSAKDMSSAVTDGLKNLPSAVANLGLDIIRGLWNGIQNGASWLWDKVTGFCSDFIDGFKAGFGINSPSRKMRDLVGKFLPPGIANGFSAMMPQATNSMLKDVNKSIAKMQDNIDTIKIDAETSVNSKNIDFNSNGTLTTKALFDYELVANMFYDMLKQAPIQPNVSVEMGDGNVYFDKERVGRAVAPVVERVIVT